jgi:hypothetical protein
LSAGALFGVAAAGVAGGVAAELWLADVPAGASRQDVEAIKWVGGGAFVAAGVCAVAAGALAVVALVE